MQIKIIPESIILNVFKDKSTNRSINIVLNKIHYVIKLVLVHIIMALIRYIKHKLLYVSLRSPCCVYSM